MPATTFDPSLSVQRALDGYLTENGFSIEGYRASHFQVSIGVFTLRLPNFRARREVIKLHDLHHIVTGYGTDLAGEAEQSAWELVAGIHSWFLWWFKLSAIAMGLVIAPRRVIRAVRRARGQRTLYRDALDYQQLLSLSVGELRQQLGVPLAGQAEHPNQLHRRAPARGG